MSAKIAYNLSAAGNLLTLVPLEHVPIANLKILSESIKLMPWRKLLEASKIELLVQHDVLLD